VPIDTTPDHVAAAVPSIGAAATRWIDELGGGWVAPAWEVTRGGFATRQAGSRAAPSSSCSSRAPTTASRPASSTRYGAGIHHVTLKVPALLPAVATLEEAGLDLVDVSAEGGSWHEAFLGPSQVGGLIVQLAWSPRRRGLGRRSGRRPRPPAGRGAAAGPAADPPRPRRGGRVWRLLGAEVSREGEVLRVCWPDAPLDIEVVPGERARPLGLRMAGTPPLPADEIHGPRSWSRRAAEDRGRAAPGGPGPGGRGPGPGRGRGRPGITGSQPIDRLLVTSFGPDSRHHTPPSGAPAPGRQRS
jgi:hypothetical protein